MSKENCLLLLTWSKLQRFKFWKRLYVHYVAFRKVTEALWTFVHFLKFDGSKYVHSVAFRKTPLIFYFQHWAICNMRCFYNFLTPPLIQRRQEIAIMIFSHPWDNRFHSLLNILFVSSRKVVFGTGPHYDPKKIFRHFVFNSSYYLHDCLLCNRLWNYHWIKRRQW